jgi:hypothetical protein
VFAGIAESGDSDESDDSDESGDGGPMGESGDGGAVGAERGADAPLPLLDGFATPLPLAAAPFDAGVNGRAATPGRE